jgi:DNA-directed RNA polymerase specialized sigma24 family protein
MLFSRPGQQSEEARNERSVIHALVIARCALGLAGIRSPSDRRQAMKSRNENTGEAEQQGAAQLVACVAAGDRKALARLQLLYWDKVCAVIRYTLDNEAAEPEIEEIASRVFDTMRGRATTYDPARAAVWPWLRGIAEYTAKNARRSHRSRREREKKWTYVHQVPDSGSMTIYVRPDGGSIALHEAEWEPERANRRRVRDVNKWMRMDGPNWLGEVPWMFRVHSGLGGVTFEMCKKSEKKSQK